MSTLSRSGSRCCAAATLALASIVQAQTPPAPPRPPGSELVVVEPGLSVAEQKRSARAHKDRGIERRNLNAADGPSGNGPPASPPAPDTAPGASILLPFGTTGRTQ